jgi:hypothetical protein
LFGRKLDCKHRETVETVSINLLVLNPRLKLGENEKMSSMNK